MFELVKTTTKDNLLLSGLFVRGNIDKPVVIHIHGFEGDFFTNSFILSIADEIKKINSSFLTVQTRGMANEYALNIANKDGVSKKIGAHLELLKEAFVDIDAWIKFLQKEGYKNIVLQGHSLGTIKVIRYLFEGSYKKSVGELILLAPFDNIYLVEDFTKGKWLKYLEIAKRKVTEGKGEEIVPKEYLDVSLSYKTYISWFENNDFTKMFSFYDKSYGFRILNKITIPVKVIVGSKDEYFYTFNPTKPQEVIDILRKNIDNFSYKLIGNATHSYKGYESIVAKEVVNFIQ